MTPTTPSAAPHRPLSRTLQSALAELRDQFTPYARTFDALLARKRDLAPRFMRTYALWQRETGRSFVAFVQQLDPTVPADKAHYANHRSVIAARYLKRVVDAPTTVAGAHTRRSRSPLDMLAIVLKSALPLVRPHEAALWSAFAATSHWHQRDLARLQARVRRAKAIPLRPDVPRLVAAARRLQVPTPAVAAAADR